MRRDPIENARRKLVEFLRREVIAATAEEPLTKIELRHVDSGKRVLCTWRMKPDEAVNVDDIVQESLEQCQDDADGLGGPQQYMLVSYFADGARFASSSPVVRIRGEEDPEDVALVKRGGRDEVVTGLFKMVGDLHKLVMAERSSANNSLLQALEFQSDVNRRYYEGHAAILTQREELADKQAERALEAMREERRLELQGELFEHAKIIGPAILAKIKGIELPKSLPAGRVDGLSETVMQLMSTLSEEQAEKLMAMLSPAQRIGLQTVFAAYIDEAKKRADQEEHDARKKKNGRKRPSAES